MLSNENGNKNTLAGSYYVDLIKEKKKNKKKNNNKKKTISLNSLTKEEKSWACFVAFKQNRK